MQSKMFITYFEENSTGIYFCDRRANEGLFYPNADLKKEVAGVWKRMNTWPSFPINSKIF